MTPGQTPLGAAPIETDAEARPRQGCALVLVALPCVLAGLALAFFSLITLTFPGCPPNPVPPTGMRWFVLVPWVAFLVPVSLVVVASRRGFREGRGAWTALAIASSIAAFGIALASLPFLMPLC